MPSAGRRMTRLVDSMMSPITSIRVRAADSACRAWASPMPIDESAIAGQNRGTAARYAAVRMPSPSVSFQRCLPEVVQVLARGVGPRLEFGGEGGDPVVVVDELVLVHVGVVHAVDARRLQGAVVRPVRADEVSAAAGLVQVVVQVGAGGHDAVDGAVADEAGDGKP